MNYHELSDVQWQAIESFFQTQMKRGRGKPHAPWRQVVNSILFVLATGAKWDALPKLPSFASKSVAHRWYKAWQRSGLLDQILAKLQGLSMGVRVLKFPATRVRVPKMEEAPLAVAVG